MNETLITLQGYVGGQVRIRAAGESQVATFRVACTPRRWSRKEQKWSDAATQWYSVSCWRSLAHHVDRSLRRGDPVVVHGRLSTHVWVNSEGVEVTAYDVEALFVGHDLNRGTSTFTKTPRPLAVTDPSTADPADPAEPATSAAA